MSGMVERAGRGVRAAGVRTARVGMASPPGRGEPPTPEVGGGGGGLRPARPLLALLLLPVLGLLSACASGGGAAGPEPDPTQLEYAPELNVDFSRMEQRASGLWIEVVAEGVGRVASRGREALILYVAHLPDGTVVDSSIGGEPLAFEIGGGEVIRAWEQAVTEMRVGGRVRLVVRPGLAYGSRGKRPTIPPQSVLVFDLQLVDVR